MLLQRFFSNSVFCPPPLVLSSFWIFGVPNHSIISRNDWILWYWNHGFKILNGLLAMAIYVKKLSIKQKSHPKKIKMIKLDVNLEVRVIGSRKLAYWWYITTSMILHEQNSLFSFLDTKITILFWKFRRFLYPKMTLIIHNSQ